MQFAVMSNRKVAQTLPTSTVWHGDKVKGRPVTWALRNKVFSVALCTCFFLFALIVLVLHLLEDRDLSLLCRRSVEDTLQKAYSGAANFNRNSGSLEDSGKGVGISGGGEFGTQTRPKVLGFVGIQTGFDSSLRRKVLRQTWFPSTSEGVFRLEEATGLAFRFVIGHTNDAGRMRALQEEVDEHKDFFRIDVDETYQKLNMKTLAYFRAAYMLFDADFYVKADDDIYLRPDRLATLLLKERPTPRTYLGCMKKGPVITDPKLKWYEPDGYMLGTEYFLHAYGPIYALSREVVAGLATSRNDSHRMFMNEDVTIGVWMLAMDVTHEDNQDLCDPECGPTSIAVWDLPRCSGLCNPTERMLELHQDETCAKSL